MQLIIKEKWLYAGIALFELSGLLYMVFTQRMERIVLFLSFAVILAGLVTFRQQVRMQFGILSALQLLQFIVFLMDALIYANLRPLVYGASMLAVFILSTEAINSNYNEKLLQLCLDVYELSFAVVLILCLIRTPNIAVPYTGIFANSNGMGYFAAACGTLTIAKLAEKKTRNTLDRVLHIALLFLCGFLVFASACRGAFLVFILQLAILFFQWLLSGGWADNKRMLLACIPVLAIVVLMLLWSTGVFEMFDAGIASKNKLVASRGNISSNRALFWSFIWNHSGLYGNGTDLLDLWLGGPSASHNVYFGLMNQFGKLCAVPFFLFVLVTLYKAFAHMRKNERSEHRYLPVLAAVGFFIASMLENFILTPAMIIMYISLPCLGRDREAELKKFEKTEQPDGIEEKDERENQTDDIYSNIQPGIGQIPG